MVKREARGWGTPGVMPHPRGARRRRGYVYSKATGRPHRLVRYRRPRARYGSRSRPIRVTPRSYSRAYKRLRSRNTKRVKKSICPAVMKCIREATSLKVSQNIEPVSLSQTGLTVPVTGQNLGFAPGCFTIHANDEAAVQTATATTWDPTYWSFPMIAEGDASNERCGAYIKMSSANNKHFCLMDWPAISTTSSFSQARLQDRWYCIEMLVKSRSATEFAVFNSPAGPLEALRLFNVRKCNQPLDPSTMGMTVNLMNPQDDAAASRVTPTFQQWKGLPLSSQQVTTKVVQFRSEAARIVRYKVRKFKRPYRVIDLRQNYASETDNGTHERQQLISCGFNYRPKPGKKTVYATGSTVPRGGYHYVQIWHYVSPVQAVPAINIQPSVVFYSGHCQVKYRDT